MHTHHQSLAAKLAEFCFCILSNANSFDFPVKLFVCVDITKKYAVSTTFRRCNNYFSIFNKHENQTRLICLLSIRTEIG